MLLRSYQGLSIIHRVRFSCGNRVITSISKVITKYTASRRTMTTITSEREVTRNTLTLKGGNSQSFLETVRQKLDFLNTKFYLKSGEVEVIQDPSKFYSTLKTKISNAQNKVFMASLYVGKSEKELIDCISDALAKNEKLKVHFMVDGLRGTRETPDKCSASLLAELQQKYGERVNLRCYRTPEFSGWRTMIPKRFNEGLGLQHMKIYGFDDEVMLSGANLSQDYFTNRQDRYYLFKNKSLSDYYFKVHQLVGNISYKVVHSNNEQQYDLLWPESNLTEEPAKDKQKFVDQCSSVFSNFLRGPSSMGNEHLIRDFSQYPTLVYPVSQFSPLFYPNNDLSTEKPGILGVLSCLSHPQSRWTFTAGYFNMLPEIKHKLLSSPSIVGQVITASPHANGFFRSHGVSGYLPDAYLYLSKSFLKEVRQNGKEDQIKLREWRRGTVNESNGWSYHAKGLWLSEKPDDPRPSLTVIGSSNYTKRAYSLDLETNAIVLTTDEELKNTMQNELDNILKHTNEITLHDFESDLERKISPGVKIATKIIGNRL